LRLAELLATRLCHDLSGSVGTLMGSLAMCNEDPESGEEALSLATEVSANLAKRLRLIRAAWGGATAALGLDELRGLAEGVAQGRRIAISFAHLPAAARFPPGPARLMLNLLLLAGESLPGGGTVTVAGDPADSVVVTLAGPRAAWPAGFAAQMVDEARAWAALEGDDAHAARGMQAPLTVLVAQAAGLRLRFLMAPGQEAVPPLVFSPRD